MMPQDQAAPLLANHHAAPAARGHPVPREGAADVGCMNTCQSINGGSCTCDIFEALDYDLWFSIKKLDKTRVMLERYRDNTGKENLERYNTLLQQQHDSLNTHWSACYGELQREGEKTARALQKTLRELEGVNAKLQEQSARNNAAEAATRELRDTLERQNHEIVRSRGLHFQIETLEKEIAEAKSVTQATEAVLVLQKQRVTELEAAQKAMAGQLEDERAQHESLKQQHNALEADYADAVDIATSLSEGPDGTTLTEFLGQHRALEQEVRELRAENETQVERLAALSKEQGTESTGDESKTKRRKRSR